MKKIAVTVISTGIALLFTACSWSLPETVSVKTDADYNISLGKFEKSLENDMRIGSMMGGAGENNANISTYDYFPGKSDKRTQHYLLDVKVLDAVLLAPQSESTVNSIFGTEDSIDNLSGLSIQNVPNGTIPMDFNPASLVAGIKNNLGQEVAEKITFSSVPMYLYCKTAEGLTANVSLEIFYANQSNSSTNQNGNKTISISGSVHKPKPQYTFENSVLVTDLGTNASATALSVVNITNLVNKKAEDGSALSSIQANDKLWLSYSISNVAGTITRAEALNGFHIELYAVIDLPLLFTVSSTQDVEIDVKQITNGESSSSSSSSSDDSANEELTKYLSAIDSISVKYIAYKLPFYSKTGMQLGIDILGDNTYEWGALTAVDRSRTITDKDKTVINLSYSTVEKIKRVGKFNPGIKVKMQQGSKFSVPREKAVEMNLELGIKTDGVVKVK